MIVSKEDAWVFDVDERTTLLRFIERAGLISLQGLADFSGCEEAQIVALLDTIESRAQVEWLRPIGARSHVHATFCRWRQPFDRQYVWEQDYFEGRKPAGQSGGLTPNNRKDHSL